MSNTTHPTDRLLMSHPFAYTVLLCFPHAATGDGHATAPVPRKPVKQPGIVIDVEQRCLDLEARICLEDGLLHLVACSAGTKEHESVVSLIAQPMHIPRDCQCDSQMQRSHSDRPTRYEALTMSVKAIDNETIYSLKPVVSLTAARPSGPCNSSF